MAAIKADIINAVYADCCKFLRGNVISIKALRTFAGRVVHVASLLFVWLPFIKALWAPISDGSSSDAPKGCIWTKQVASSLLWIKEFIDGTKGATEREFHVDAYFGRVLEIVITFDASPWGLGGILSEGGSAVEFSPWSRSLTRSCSTSR